MFHVLLVEDDPVLLEVTKISLEKMGGFVVSGVLDASAALNRICTDRYSAIVSDYDMPGMNGLEFLKTVRSSGNTTPFIIFTGKGREEIAIEAYELGADHYIQKGGDARSTYYEIIQKINTCIEKKQIGQKLDRTRKLYTNIFNHLPDPTFVIDNAGKIIGWNAAMETLTGVPAREMIGKGDYAYSEVLYGKRRPILIDLIRDPKLRIDDEYQIITCDDGFFTAEKSIVSAEGKQYAVWVKVSPLMGDQKKIVGAIASIRDITEKKIAEEKIRQAEEYSRCLIETHIDPLVTTDAIGRITDVNAAMETLTGFTRDVLAGTSFFDLFLDKKKAETGLRQVLEGGFLRDLPLSVVDARGKKIQVLFFGSPYRDSSGTVRGVFVELHDFLTLPAPAE
jgi:PAS domain S-box-containing protein